MQERQKLYPHLRAHRRGCCKSAGLKTSRQIGQSGSSSIIGLVSELNEGMDQFVEGYRGDVVSRQLLFSNRGSAFIGSNEAKIRASLLAI